MTRNQPKRPETGLNHLKPVLPTLKPAETSPSLAQLSETRQNAHVNDEGIPQYYIKDKQ